MMRSPKYRKGKKPAYSAPVAVMFMLAAVLGMQFGCTDSATGPTEAEQTGIDKAVYGAIAGDVHDLYYNHELRNVLVTLQGVKQKYTTRTDSKGHFRINNVYLGTVTGLSGGAGDVGGWGEGSEPQRVEFDFPLYFEVNGYAPWKEQVALDYEYIVDNGTIVVPSSTFFEVGRTGLMPYVQSFSGTVYAGDNRTPARGAVVMLDHVDYPSSTSDWPDCNGNCPDCDANDCDSDDDYVRLVNSSAKTDDNGVFMFDLDDQVVAYDDYHLIVTPYDVLTENSPEGCVLSCEGSEDPDCVECECFACEGDGIYEYDSMVQDLNLEPQPDSGFDLMGYDLDSRENPIVVQTHEYAVNLRHGSNSLEVIYCSLSNMGGGILPVNYNDFTINVTFNYPLRAWYFRVLKEGRYPVAIRVEPTSSANFSFDITPIEQLNVAGNTWEFEIVAVEDYMGNTSVSCDEPNLGCDDCDDCSWSFNVAGYVDPFVPFAPWVDVNTGSSQGFQSTVVDRSWIYRLYKEKMDTAPGSVYGVMQSGGDQLPRINLAFNTPIAPVGTLNGYSYYAYVRDSVENTAWVQLPVQGAYDDGQQVEGYIDLPDNFRYSAGGDNNYLGDGKEIHITILAVNQDGLIVDAQLSGLTPGSYLALEDAWGPMIVDSNTRIYGSNGSSTTAIGALYDATANIALHEILDGSVPPTATTTSANFGVTAVYMDEKHTFVTTEFAPTVTATLVAAAPRGSNILVVDDVAGFYPGDDLALFAGSVKTEGSGGPYSDLELDGYDDTTNILILNRTLSTDHAAGETVALLGPMQEGIDAGDWANKLQASTQDSAVYIAVAPDALGNLPQSGTQLIVDGQEIVTVTSGNNLPIMISKPLLSAYVAGTPVASAMAGFGDSDGDCCDVDDVDTVGNTVLLLAAVGGATSIVVEDGTDIAAGDWLQLAVDDNVQVASVEAGAGTEATITFVDGHMLHYTYPARLTAVVELTVVSQSATLLAYPLIDVAYGIDNLLPGAAISILDSSVPENVYSATVLSTYDAPGDNNWIGLTNLAPEVCEGTCQVSNFGYWSDVIAPANTRTDDVIQINVSDTSGNNSLATDKDGDAQADFDELELWSGGVVK